MSIAMVFPGQGSQSQGMQADLAAEYPLVQETYAEASEILGYDLWQLVQDGPTEKLAETVVTQPRDADRRVRILAGVAGSGRDTGGTDGRAQPGRVHGACMRWGYRICRCGEDRQEAIGTHAGRCTGWYWPPWRLLSALMTKP